MQRILKDANQILLRTFITKLFPHSSLPSFTKSRIAKFSGLRWILISHKIKQENIPFFIHQFNFQSDHEGTLAHYKGILDKAGVDNIAEVIDSKRVV